MTDIQRYRWTHHSTKGIVPDPSGELALYGDHVEALRRVRGEIRDAILDYYKVAPKAAAPLLRKTGLDLL
jgi:hypothetical protein